MTKPVVTVAYRTVKGATKLYPYVGAKVYRPVARRDGVLTYRPVAEPGPDRRSTRLAEKDAREHAASRGYAFLPGIRLGCVAGHIDDVRAEIYNQD